MFHHISTNLAHIMNASKAKLGEKFSRVDFVILSFAFTYWMLPIASGYRYVWGVRLTTLLPMVVLLIIKFHRFRPVFSVGQPRVVVILLYLFAGLWIVAVVRTAIREFGATFFILEEFLFFGVLILHLLVSWLYSIQDDAKAFQVRYSIFLTFGVFILANVILYALGVRQPDQIYLTAYPSQVLSFIGLDVHRVIFPLSSGINSFGVLAGAVFMLYVPYLDGHRSWKEKATAVVMMLSCGLVIIMTDSRGAILYAVAALIVCGVPGRLFRYSRWIPLIASLLPIAVMVFTPSLLQNLDWISRPPSELSAQEKAVLQSQYCGDRVIPSSGALSNRPLIWSAVLGELRQPKSIHVIGYGFRGQVFSGISDEISCIFISFVERRLASAHNMWLQTILDLGYVGFCVVIGLTTLIILRLSDLSIRSGDVTYKGMLYAILYLIFAGTLEAILSPDYMGTYLIYILIAVTTVMSNDSQIAG